MDKKDEGITAVLIFEVIGRPPEKLTEALENIIKKIKEEGADIKNKSIKEPVSLKDKSDFFITFCEVEINIKGIMELIGIIFKYMPANVEIVEPESIKLENSNWTEILSEITRRLHGYDEVARVLQIEKIVLEKKLRDLTDRKG